MSEFGALLTKTDAKQDGGVVSIRVPGNDKNWKAGEFFISIVSGDLPSTEVAVKASFHFDHFHFPKLGTC